jgi:hypothetical protein
LGRRHTRKAERRQQRRSEPEPGWLEGAGEEAARRPRRFVAEPRALGPGGDPAAGRGRGRRPFGVERAPARGGASPEEDLFHALIGSGEARSASTASQTCGGCREFVEDGELGRGTCLHPGSGVLHPWRDTERCDFWSGAGRRRG